jgi:hypothetical protein
MRSAVAIAALLLSACSTPAPEPDQDSHRPPPKITQFYADRSEVGPGERALLCYGVENATEVRIEPPLERLTPSFSRCIEVRPSETTTYTLTAVGERGQNATASLAIRRTSRAASPQAAQPAPPVDAGGPQILEFTARPAQAAGGASVTLCYAVQNATSVRIEPSSVQLGAVQRGCFYVTPEQTTTYTLTASGAGTAATKQITVNVR